MPPHQAVMGHGIASSPSSSPSSSTRSSTPSATSGNSSSIMHPDHPRVISRSSSCPIHNSHNLSHNHNHNQRRVIFPMIKRGMAVAPLTTTVLLSGVDGRSGSIVPDTSTVIDTDNPSSPLLRLDSAQSSEDAATVIATADATVNAVPNLTNGVHVLQHSSPPTINKHPKHHHNPSLLSSKYPLPVVRIHTAVSKTTSPPRPIRSNNSTKSIVVAVATDLSTAQNIIHSRPPLSPLTITPETIPPIPSPCVLGSIREGKPLQQKALQLISGSPQRRSIILPPEHARFYQLNGIGVEGSRNNLIEGRVVEESPKPLKSILRRSKSCGTPSSSSSTPTPTSPRDQDRTQALEEFKARMQSLAQTKAGSSATSSSTSTTTTFTKFPPMPMMSSMRRTVSEPPIRTIRAISFDPRVWVREFERTKDESDSTWYSCRDLETFRRHALALILAREKMAKTQYLPTSTGRTIARPPTTKSTTMFTHTALSLDDTEDETTSDKALKTMEYRSLVLRQNIQHVLLVDPHDICLSLFAKSMQGILPNAKFSFARSGEDALKHLATGKRFDIVLVEERLKVFHRQDANSGHPNSHISPQETKGSADWKFGSGAALIRTISKLEFVNAGILFIGVSAHMNQDKKKLEQSGADFTWSKPPPRMDMDLQNEILKKILIKRDKQNILNEIFGATTGSN